MRIINNNLGIQTNDKTRSEGVNGNANQKLVELLLASDHGTAVLEGQLLAKTDHLVKLQLTKVGVVEVPLKQGSATPLEGSQINVKLNMSEGALSAELLPLSDENADVSKSKSSDQLLSKLNLPLTKSNQEAAELLIQYKIEPSAEKIKQLAEGSFLASKINEQLDQPEMDQTLTRLVRSMVNKESLASPSDHQDAISLKKIAVDLVQNKAQAMDAIPSKLETNEPGLSKRVGEVPQDQRANASSNLTGDLIEADVRIEESVKAIKQTLQGIDAKKILALMSLGENLEVDQLQKMKKTFGGDEGQIHLKHRLMDQLREQFSLKDPSQTLKNALEAWVNDSGNKVDVRALNSLETLLRENEPQLYGSMKETIESVRSLSTMIEQLPQQVFGLQIPVLIDQRESQLEIYVNQRKAKKSNEGFKMLLALQTENFDQVQILVSDFQQKLSVDFKLADAAALKAFNAELDTLKAELRLVTTQSVEVSAGLKFDEPIVLTVLGFMGKDGSSQIDARV